MANQYGSNEIHLIEIKFSSLQENSGSAKALVKHSWDMSELKKLQGKEYEKIHKNTPKQNEYGERITQYNYWSEAVLNGIAWIPNTDQVLLTGKMWDLVFQVDLNYK